MNDFLEAQKKKLIQKFELVSPTQLVQDANCKILYWELDTIIGGLTLTSSRCHTIIVNSNDKQPMHDFVLLHELSHIVLHKGISTPFFKKIMQDSFISKVESEANQLALSLLVELNKNELENKSNYEIIKFLGLPQELERFL